METHHPETRHRYAASVPLALLFGVMLALAEHWPIYDGLFIALLWSAGYSKRFYSWPTILKSAAEGVQTMWKVCVVLFLVGAVVALWMDNGTIRYLMWVGSTFIHPQNIIWCSFLFAAVLSMMIGSSIATWSVLAAPLIHLAPVQFAPIIAGALVSGAMVGDRASPMSTSVIIMGTACDTTYEETLRHVNKTSLVPVGLTFALFIGANWWMTTQSSTAPIGRVVSPMLMYRGVPSWVFAIPPLVVILLALFRVPILQNLLIALLIALAYGRLLAEKSITNLAQSAWQGAQTLHGGHLELVAGMHAMVAAALLIVVAGAFQGVTTLGGSVDFLANQLFRRVKRAGTFVFTSYGLCVLFSMLMGSQTLSVLMSGNTLREPFDNRRLAAKWRLSVVSDAALLAPALISWNLLGLQAGIIIGVSTLSYLPYAWFIYLSILFSMTAMSHHVYKERTPTSASQASIR